MTSRIAIVIARLAVGLACCLAPTCGAWPRDMGANSDSELVTIPAGAFRAFLKQKTEQSVAVAQFQLAAAPVTRRQYLDFVRRNPNWRRSNVKALFAERTYLADWIDDLSPGENVESPVAFVSWFAARAFCADRDERLPTVAEWERAAGAAKLIATANPAAAVANSKAPFLLAIGRTAADIRSTSIAFGNVWEWTADFNSAIALGDSGTNGRSSLFCGAGFRSNNATDYAAFLRYSFRSSLRASYTLKTLGFRCAK